ncbi:LytR/AlgR family response regulator transcription factor [Chitinimonas sp.]|uniref:LytR/AlgR family response regulator transcription factor n=1 Tax=Chitinimonas sp. TaxID=1934313 RepID=UPI0035B4F30C
MKPPPTALIAEDESTLRQELIERLGQLWPELNIVGEAADGITALRFLGELQPDIAFLDIEMPGVSGLEVARQQPHVSAGTHVVFVTAYDQHAIDAFEAGAIDYLLKPLQTTRLFTCINRLKQRQPGPSPATEQLTGRAAPVAAHFPPPAPLRWINASCGSTLRLLMVDDVLYFQADTKYTRVVTHEGDALIRKSLKELASELDGQQFWQIHRSTVVNVAAIASAARDMRGRLQLALKGRDETLLVAESYTHLFRQM